MLDVKELKKYIDSNFKDLLQNVEQNKLNSQSSFFTISFKDLESKGVVLHKINNNTSDESLDFLDFLSKKTNNSPKVKNKRVGKY